MQWLKFYLQQGNMCKFDIHVYTAFESTLSHVIVKFTTQVSACFNTINNTNLKELIETKSDFMITLSCQEFEMITSRQLNTLSLVLCI